MDFKRLQITLNKEEVFFVCLICFVFFSRKEFLLHVAN